jgi:RNA polymerase sigma factor (sigma-70 family)
MILDLESGKAHCGHGNARTAKIGLITVSNRMDDLIKLVRTFRFAAALDERVRLIEEIFPRIEPDLRFYVFSAIRPSVAEDVLQEVLKAIATSMGTFRGNSNEEFWGWCYSITRNKINDQFRRQARDRLQPMSPEELCQLADASENHSSLSAGDKHDLEYAMNLLNNSKPECYEYLRLHYLFGLTYAEIAAEQHLKYDTVRMKVGRCLDEAQSLVS